MEQTNNNEWLSVSEAAERRGVSDQTVYNRVNDGIYESMEFKRGKMRGVLVRCPN